MKNYTAESIRNVGVFGHAGEGKTTLVETILFDAGLTDRIGKVENGTTVSDFDPEEAKRSCSINMTVEPVEWKNTKINFIDAPGGYDFYGDVASAAFLADSALIVVGAVSGPVVGAEKAMAMCQAQSMPRMMVNEKFGPNVVPIQLPIMEGSNFKGFVDIINMTAYLFDGKNLKEVAIPGNLSDEAQTLYEKLTEAAAEADEELMEKYFEEMELPKEDILVRPQQGRPGRHRDPRGLHLRPQQRGRVHPARQHRPLPALRGRRQAPRRHERQRRRRGPDPGRQDGGYRGQDHQRSVRQVLHREGPSGHPGHQRDPLQREQREGREALRALPDPGQEDHRPR